MPLMNQSNMCGLMSSSFFLDKITGEFTFLSKINSILGISFMFESCFNIESSRVKHFLMNDKKLSRKFRQI